MKPARRAERGRRAREWKPLSVSELAKALPKGTPSIDIRTHNHLFLRGLDLETRRILIKYGLHRQSGRENYPKIKSESGAKRVLEEIKIARKGLLSLKKRVDSELMSSGGYKTPSPDGQNLPHFVNNFLSYPIGHLDLIETTVRTRLKQIRSGK